MLKTLLAKADAAILAKSLNAYGIYFPSAYELLPIVHSTRSCQEGFNWSAPEPEQQQPIELHLLHRIAAVEIDLFSADFWRELGWPVQLKAEEREAFLQQNLPKLLSSAKAFLCDIANYDVDKRFDVTRVAARNVDTVCTVDVSELDTGGGQFRTEARTPMCGGDGTVPYWIAANSFRSDADRRQPDLSRHATLIGDTEFLSYLSDLYPQLMGDFIKNAAEKAGSDSVATVMARVGYLPPSSLNEGAGDPALTDVQRKTIVKLGIRPKEILDLLTKTMDQPSAQTDSRAAAYRLFVDVTSGDPGKQAWALNNAAEIYLGRSEFSQAENLGKKALNIADAPGIDRALPPRKIRELKWKAALTVSIAADKLGNKSDAIKFCKMSIENGSGKGPYLAPPSPSDAASKRSPRFFHMRIAKTRSSGPVTSA